MRAKLIVSVTLSQSTRPEASQVWTFKVFMCVHFGYAYLSMCVNVWCIVNASLSTFISVFTIGTFHLLSMSLSSLDGLVVCHLPFGPTAYFTLYNVVMRHDVPDIGTMSEAYPHLIFHNFTSRLGRRVSYKGNNVLRNNNKVSFSPTLSFRCLGSVFLNKNNTFIQQYAIKKKYQKLQQRHYSVIKDFHFK